MKKRRASFADYSAHIKRILDRYKDIIIDLVLEVFEATPLEGFIRGSILFSDGSRLYFLEYVKIVETHVVKLKYRYHYEDADGKLVFRYDNAPHHREVQSFPHHKHLANGSVRPSREPSLENVLEDAASRIMHEDE